VRKNVLREQAAQLVVSGRAHSRRPSS